MSFVNAGLRVATDVLLAPFSAMDPMLGLTLASLVTAAAMLVVFKRTSDQARLAAVKRLIHAALFEIRLFNDDLLAIMRAQLEILRHNATYLRLSLVPMLWVIVPLVLVIAQLQFHYGYAPLMPGDRTLLKVGLRSNGSAEAVSLEVPPGLLLDTPAVRLPGANEVVWRLRPTQAGEYDLRVTVGAESYTKRVQVAGGVVRRSPVRLEGSFWNQLLYPSEPPLPDEGPVSAITVAYREQDLAVFGWSLNWMVWYFALSLIFAFALRKPFGVTI
jgi:uncharacterized membrane protein (DUF106 family)